MRKWREKMQRKGLKSSIEDEKIDKYINVHSSSHGMDSEDFGKLDSRCYALRYLILLDFKIFIWMMNITLITSFSYFLCWIARPYFVFRNIFRNYGRDTYDSVGTNRNACRRRLKHSRQSKRPSLWLLL